MTNMDLHRSLQSQEARAERAEIQRLYGEIAYADRAADHEIKTGVIRSGRGQQPGTSWQAERDRRVAAWKAASDAYEAKTSHLRGAQ